MRLLGLQRARRRVGIRARRGLALVALVTSGSFVGFIEPAGAETRPAVVPGQAKGRAESFSVKFQISGSFGEGGVALGLVQGISLSDSRDDTSSAEGRVLDYGLIDALNRLPTPACPNIIPLFNPDTLPPITRVDRDQPDAGASRLTTVRTAGWPTFGPEVGVQDAVAGPGPTATGTTRIASVDGGFLSATDVVSEVRSRVAPDGTRLVTSTVTATRLDLMGGLVTFVRPRFEATSGTGRVGTGGFTYDAASILGNWRSFADAQRDLPGFTGFIEGLLGFVGFKIDWPTVTVTQDPTTAGGATATERVKVTPLRVRLSDLPIGRDLLRPILQAFGPQIDEAIDNYLADPCANQALRLILDVARDFASGVGEMGVSFGGVDVETNDRFVATPIIGGLPEPLSVTTPPPVAVPVTNAEVFIETPLPRSVTNSSLPSATTVPVTTAPPATVPAEVKGTEIARARPAVAVAASTSRSVPGSKGGAAMWVGLGVAAFIVALAAGDRFVIRRSSRAASS